MMLDPETVQAIHDLNAQMQFMVYMAQVGVASVFGLFIHRLVAGR